MARRTTIRDLHKSAQEGRKLSMVTAYDAFSARLVDEAGIDMALVGDSLGTTVQGRDNTLAVTLEHTLYHTEIVARCTRRAFVVADMPLGSYQCGENAAVANCIACIKAGAQGVKLEGGARVTRLVQRLTEAGVPVMGHLGFTPQSIHATSGPRLNKAAETLLADARALAAAGAFALVLEMVPAAVAREITAACPVPTIGIGAGPHCAGQVLVFFDMLGYSPEFSPKFLKRYMQFHEQALAALNQYRSEVEAGKFPGEEHSY
ncbi:3-methyl-2-oxobutanoate hydroxymethyltransferase [bacterium]|nr:MAG: 3-methyl-2-oxobutanoate hydroxymethyltransferase [bacterium]RIK63333.1 MAG: 3-methyl-2-oxobutanoate hydroxymethyltransferase [Planctomycetota bacterium]